LLKRPGTEPMVKAVNDQIDAMTAAFKPGGFGIKIQDVEQVLGRITFGGEKKPGKRQVMSSLNVLRMTHDVDWVKLRDLCGPIMKQHRYKGETYVSFPLPDMLKGISGTRGDGYLWAADARTLMFDAEDVIKAQIDARASGTKVLVPDFAAGWSSVSRGLFAVALDNRDRRVLNRTMTDAEMKAFLADPSTPECHAAQFCQNATHVVMGFAGGDDFRFDLWATADTPDAARGLVRNCEALVAVLRKNVANEKSTGAAGSDNIEAAAFAFMRKVAERATVRRNGAVVTLHAEAGSGFNSLISEYMKALQADMK
jgi:hypothetical protein